MPTNIDPDVLKKAVKEALKEWLSEQAAEFGWFSLKWLGSVAVAGIILMWFATHGWKVL